LDMVCALNPLFSTTDDEGNVWFRAVMVAFVVEIPRMSVVPHSDLIRDSDHRSSSM
jgi:hypothetical protein